MGTSTDVLDTLAEIVAEAVGAWFQGCLVSLVVLGAAIAAVVAFATGHAHEGRIAVWVLLGALVYGTLLAVERLRRLRADD